MMVIYYGIKVKKEDGSWDWDKSSSGEPFIFNWSKEQVEQMASTTFPNKEILDFKVEEHSRYEDIHATPFGIEVKKIKGDIYQGNWKCPTSPTKKCHFNVKEDPACDECLFCGEPEERF